MPTYEYICPTNRTIVEVAHRMSERLATWGELCERSGADPGETPEDTPVERLLSAPMIATDGKSDGFSDFGCGNGACDMPNPMGGGGGCCCGGGGCSH